ncbi:Rieske (2Fe-2S) protein [Elongatibacter sediminis]|uniref:Rieske 2Fe-2S domain-containing protein n=1 Tax=Elongatibacter sediminis TaxID=3119006 RepID=A0AAW9RE62_9GAMM
MAQRLCRIEEIGEFGKDLALPHAEGTRYLMLFRRDGRVVAYDNVCPHHGLGLNLAPGRFHFTRDGWLMCAHHGASFDLETGSCVSGPCRGAALKPATVEVRGQEVWLTDPDTAAGGSE